MSHYEPKPCRICQSELKTILNLGDIAVSDFTDSTDQHVAAPLDFCICEKCDLVQLRHDVDRDIMYRKYYYKSGLNASMVKELEDVANRLKEYAKLVKGDSVLDIGANDGTFLKNFDKDIFKVGIDPSNVAKDSATLACDLFVNNYFPSEELVGRHFKAIASIAMFYDLPDPKGFVSSIKTALEKNGVWVVQFTDLLSTFKLNAFDNICHEHLEYYSLDVLIKLWAGSDLECFAIDHSDANGASIRAFVGHKGEHVIEKSVVSYLEEELKFFHNKDEAFGNFAKAMEDNKKKLFDFMADHKRGFVLGASTKGNTLLQCWKITDKDIECALEVNSDKYGKKTVVTNIPIINQDEGMKLNPDYLLVLPWHFIGFFLKKFAPYLKNGGKIVCPLPVFTVYTDKDL
jgi:NDP-4-keto-2,6-dideoxyhexose 3-C-methyltransferase